MLTEFELRGEGEMAVSILSLVQSLVVDAILKEFRAKGWSFIPTPMSSVVRLESSLS